MGRWAHQASSPSSTLPIPEGVQDCSHPPAWDPRTLSPMASPGLVAGFYFVAVNYAKWQTISCLFGSYRDWKAPLRGDSLLGLRIQSASQTNIFG